MLIYEEILYTTAEKGRNVIKIHLDASANLFLWPGAIHELKDK